MDLQDKFKKRLNRPSRVTDAYKILNGYQLGDIEGAEEFLNSMPTSEIRLRARGEQRENSKQKMFQRNKPTLLKKAKQMRLGTYGS